jgi:hypothetical protein
MALAALLSISCTGCPAQQGTVELEAVLDVEGDTIDGALHWIFWDGDPRKKNNPPAQDCEIWEELGGVRLELEPVLCPGCLGMFHVDAIPDETSCGAAPEERMLNLGFAPVDSSDVDLTDFEKDGYPLLVRCDWDPHEQRLDQLLPLFVADLDGGGDAGTLPDGTYLLESIYLWEAE